MVAALEAHPHAGRVAHAKLSGLGDQSCCQQRRGSINQGICDVSHGWACTPCATSHAASSLIIRHWPHAVAEMVWANPLASR